MTMTVLPNKVKHLQVQVNGRPLGDLLHHSVYEFRYLPNPQVSSEQPWVSLLMPPSTPTYQDGDLFPVMDQNLPEGDLYLRLRQLYPKQPLSPMHLLALVGANGIGRLGFVLPQVQTALQPQAISRSSLLKTRFTPQVFDELVQAYLSTGAGVAGMQPKIMVPERATIPVPNLIVKGAAATYPGLAANEFLCLSAAKTADILTPDFDLSEDGQVLVLDRFDLQPNGQRLGFEDIAALMGLRVRDVLSDRKYHGSYEQVAEVLKAINLPQAELERFFEQVALTVLVKNGDGHLKNYAVLYDQPHQPRLAPLFDVVTTQIYRYTRYAGGPELVDHTMALKLFKGKHSSRGYPTQAELERFGREVCGVKHPAQTIDRIQTAMAQTLAQYASDSRIPQATWQAMREIWLG